MKKILLMAMVATLSTATINAAPFQDKKCDKECCKKCDDKCKQECKDKCEKKGCCKKEKQS